MNARVCFMLDNSKWLSSLLALVLLAGAAKAQQILSIPDEFPGIPCYTRGIATRGGPDARHRLVCCGLLPSAGVCAEPLEPAHVCRL
jgi:hypothetical protein